MNYVGIVFEWLGSLEKTGIIYKNASIPGKIRNEEICTHGICILIFYHKCAAVYVADACYALQNVSCTTLRSRLSMLLCGCSRGEVINVSSSYGSIQNVIFSCRSFFCLVLT